jgi:hypothetical protein
MSMRFVRTAALAAIILGTTAALSRQATSPEFTVHEWGTFTSVAGADGRAIDWLPLGGPTDLPCFVRHIDPVNVLSKVVPGVEAGKPLTYETARANLWGKVRMETPVIYFYAPQAITARVNVLFPHGLITEFYPTPSETRTSLTTTTLNDERLIHSVRWNVSVSPSNPTLYPNGGGESHYYAARETDATPIRVGVESEKFIFYRGVANFRVPIQTKVLANGDIEVWNLLDEGPMPAVILFENRGGKVGFRAAGAVSRSATLSPPSLAASVPAMRAELRKELVRAGLYEKEADAMLATWRDSWFEEGSRVFYVLPPRAVEMLLPLTIQPGPDRAARVFVGRQELIDDRTLSTVKNALLSNDEAALAPYNRFLSPITDRIAAGSDARTNDRISAAARVAFNRYTTQLKVCQ